VANELIINDGLLDDQIMIIKIINDGLLDDHIMIDLIVL
jgi:hypothetical protein